MPEQILISDFLQMNSLTLKQGVNDVGKMPDDLATSIQGLYWIH